MHELVTGLGPEVYCAVCGYDLRAAVVGGNCPECGAAARGAARSRLPWVHRKYRGTVRAYLQTVGVVMFRPWVLGREVEGRVGLRDGLVFHRVSVVLATVIGWVLLGVAVGFSGANWKKALAVNVPSYSLTDHAPDTWAMPVHVLSDGWWILLPLGVTLYVTLTAGMWVYRRFLGGTSGRRGRVGRLACYASGVLPVIVGLLGLLAVGGTLLYEDPPWMTDVAGQGIVVGMALISVTAAVIFYVPTFVLVARTGRGRLGRVVLMLPIFPMVLVAIGAFFGNVVFWGIGYFAMAVWSMTRP